MKKVLITGKNSYIGKSFKEFIEISYPDYIIECISIRNDEWKKLDFSNYDSILHLAALVHKNEKKEKYEAYKQINKDLTLQIAKKARNDGINQFIFLSTMNIYGLINGEINKDTMPNPLTYYGKSKYEAEIELIKLSSPSFKVSIVRPPMVYGKDCPGNFDNLKKLINIIPIFPSYKNKRSMIHIDNLALFIKLLIDNKDEGVFHPQNKNYVKTSSLVKQISLGLNKKLFMTNKFNFFIKFSLRFSKISNKIFGDLIYESSISNYKYNYWVRDFNESISLSIVDIEKNKK